MAKRGNQAQIQKFKRAAKVCKGTKGKARNACMSRELKR